MVFWRSNIINLTRPRNLAANQLALFLLHPAVVYTPNVLKVLIPKVKGSSRMT